MRSLFRLKTSAFYLIVTDCQLNGFPTQSFRETHSR